MKKPNILTDGILMPAITHTFFVSFGTQAETNKDLDSNATEFDSALVSKQVIDVNYSLSSNIVNITIEEPAGELETLSSILALKELAYSINIFNGYTPSRTGDYVIGISLYKLTLDNHYCERDYSNVGKAVVHKYRFKFAFTKPIKYEVK